MNCRGPECEREALPHREYCATHAWQKYTGRPLTPLRRYVKGGRDAREALHEAVLLLADADEENKLEWKRAWQRLFDAFKLYIREKRPAWATFKRTLAKVVF